MSLIDDAQCAHYMWSEHDWIFNHGRFLSNLDRSFMAVGRAFFVWYNECGGCIWGEFQWVVSWMTWIKYGKLWIVLTFLRVRFSFYSFFHLNNSVSTSALTDVNTIYVLWLLFIITNNNVRKTNNVRDSFMIDLFCCSLPMMSYCSWKGTLVLWSRHFCLLPFQRTGVWNSSAHFHRTDFYRLFWENSFLLYLAAQRSPLHIFCPGKNCHSKLSTNHIWRQGNYFRSPDTRIRHRTLAHGHVHMWCLNSRVAVDPIYKGK